MNRPTILVIDDEMSIRKLLRIALESHDFKVLEASTGKEGLTLAASHQPDLVILDIGLPDLSGHEVLLRLKQWFAKPVMMLSVIDEESTVIEALDHGATDYLYKPFRTGELLARIRAALRSQPTAVDQPVFMTGDLEIDLVTRTVKKRNALVKLTSTEYNLVALFVQNEGRVLTHQFILKHIWGQNYQQETQYLRVFIAQIRRKLEDDAHRPVHFQTESGVGYRFV